jgi:hypothetical protein
VVRAIVARIVMDERDLTCRIHYEIPAVSGDKLASPRGFEPRLPRTSADWQLAVKRGSDAR